MLRLKRLLVFVLISAIFFSMGLVIPDTDVFAATPAPTNVNLTLNKAVVASSTEMGFPSSYAVDGNYGSVWCATDIGSETQWIYVDLGTSYSGLNQFKIAWPYSYAKSYKIQVSEDASVWTDVYSTTGSTGGSEVINTAGSTGRYVRLYLTQRGTGYWYSVIEFEVYSTSSATPTPTPTPPPTVTPTPTPVPPTPTPTPTGYTAAPRSNVTASSESNAGWIAANAIDSNNGTAWSSSAQSQTGSQWLQIDMGTNYSISKATLVPRTYNNTVYCFPKDFKFQYSTDGTTWSDVSGQSHTSYTKPASANGEEFVFSSAVTARYIKLVGTRFDVDDYNTYYLQMAEMYLYYGNSPTPIPTPTPVPSPTPVPGSRGATVPFTTYEAENGILGGSAALNSDATIKEASSGKAYVQLNATGDYVQFNSLVASTKMTLRYSIPKNTTGTISVYINGTHNQDINLTSSQCYDTDNAGIRRYDEKYASLNIPAGATVKIQKDSGDTCAWYGIDLIDVETAPAEISMPSNFLSITSYGATSNDTTDDTSAINSCITAAAAQGKNVWIPAGTFYQNTRVSIPASVSVYGAGIWYSTIHFTKAGTTYSNDIGFALTSNSTISDIRFDGVGTARSQACQLFNPIGNNEIIKNCLIQNVGSIFGWQNGHNINVQNCRVRGTYFDGIHWGDGESYNNSALNNHFRGSGDDAIAQVNRADMGLAHDNTAQFNTIVASYWGRGISAVGGNNLTITDNIIDSTYLAGMIITTEELSPSISRPINGLQFLRNTINKCGHTGHNQASLHFWLYTTPMQNVVIADNLIQNGETEGIHIDNTGYGDSGGRTVFSNNTVRNNALTNYTNDSSLIVPVLTGNTGF